MTDALASKIQKYAGHESFSEVSTLPRVVTWRVPGTWLPAQGAWRATLGTWHPAPESPISFESDPKTRKRFQFFWSSRTALRKFGVIGLCVRTLGNVASL